MDENKLPELLTTDASHQISNLYSFWYEYVERFWYDWP